jgi:1-aminocyclopropane-1-carboxylate deaminase
MLHFVILRVLKSASQIKPKLILKIQMGVILKNISFDHLSSPFLQEKEVEVIVARLDKIHDDVSGNKLFKLHYFIEECMRSEHKMILTFGGAYSNHLAATAYLCREAGLRCTGVVRGERSPVLSHTLRRCEDLGMKLHFVSREEYKHAEDPGFIAALHDQFGDFTLVPEGGYSPQGAKGASLIHDVIDHLNATHIATAVGTATTLAGLLSGKKEDQRIIAVPVIKNMTDIQERISFLTGIKETASLEILHDYHFGGYAKYNEQLINFMNTFYDEYKVPTDFVYTAKMFYAVFDMIKKDHFPKGSRIVCLHTGGLQGNNSLPAGKLNF